MDPDTPSSPNSHIKKFKFYYKTTEQTLSVAMGTSQVEILDTLRMVFGIASDKKIMFMDEDGGLIVLSSALPNETKLTLIDQDFQFVGIGKSSTNPNGASEKWKWMRQGSTASSFVDDFSFKTNDCSPTRVYGDVKMTKGKQYWWRIKMAEIWCCQELGIASTQEALKPGFWKSKPQTYSYAIGFPDKFEGYTTGPSSTGCNSTLNWKNHVYLFYLDFKAGRVVIINENENTVLNDVKVTFQVAVPYFNSNKHSNTITLLQSGEGQVETKWINLMNKTKS